MPLFQIQDDDNPMWVVATDMQCALRAWQQHVFKLENVRLESDTEGRISDPKSESIPDGISYIAAHGQVMLVEEGDWLVV